MEPSNFNFSQFNTVSSRLISLHIKSRFRSDKTRDWVLRANMCKFPNPVDRLWQSHSYQMPSGFAFPMPIAESWRSLYMYEQPRQQLSFLHLVMIAQMLVASHRYYTVQFVSNAISCVCCSLFRESHHDALPKHINTMIQMLYAKKIVSIGHVHSAVYALSDQILSSLLELISFPWLDLLSNVADGRLQSAQYTHASHQELARSCCPSVWLPQYWFLIFRLWVVSWDEALRASIYADSRKDSPTTCCSSLKVHLERVIFEYQRHWRRPLFHTQGSSSRVLT